MITIQTHDKCFHADDVAAVSLLGSYYNKKDTKIQLVRSRDTELMKQADILVDVGFVYDPTVKRFDHHQDDCNEVFGPTFNIPLSSVGMVWKHYGKDILELYISSSEEFNIIKDWKEHLDGLHTEVYVKTIQELDGHDNGIVPVDGGKRNYWTHLSLSGIISSMNSPDTNNDEDQLRAFEKAVRFFGMVFEIKLEEIVRKYFDYIVSYNIVLKLLSENLHNEYLVVDKKIPTIYKCLNTLDPNCRIKFLIFTDGDHIAVRTRNKKDEMFTSLVPLLSYDQAVSKLSENEISELVFIHKACFIAKTKSLSLAIKLVELSLTQANNINNKSTNYSVDPKFLLGCFGIGVVGGSIGYWLLNNNE